MWFELKNICGLTGDWELTIGESQHVGFTFYLSAEDIEYIQKMLKEAGSEQE